MTSRIIVIEDESSARKHLIKLLQTVDNSLLIVGSFSTIVDSVTWLKNNPHPDLIFMDIHLSDGISFDILDETSIHCPIIFTTAYDQYAIKAFKTTGIDYLLKPITAEDLKIALLKYHKSKSKYDEEWFLKSLDMINFHANKQNSEYKQRFLLKSGNHLTPIKCKDIAYFYRDEIVFAKSTNNISYPMDLSLNQLQKLVNPTIFIRLNRQLLVNINAIKKLTTFKPGQFVIEVLPPFHETIYLSQERSSWLKKFLHEGE